MSPLSLKRILLCRVEVRFSLFYETPRRERGDHFCVDPGTLGEERGPDTVALPGVVPLSQAGRGHACSREPGPPLPPAQVWPGSRPCTHRPAPAQGRPPGGTAGQCVALDTRGFGGQRRHTPWLSLGSSWNSGAPDWTVLHLPPTPEFDWSVLKGPPLPPLIGQFLSHALALLIGWLSRLRQAVSYASIHPSKKAPVEALI